MRLLNVKTRKLEKFFDESNPDYAILSHTWGAEEVTLQDLENPDHVQKKGWTKIDGTCTLAAKENIDYIWIDTCCIDKTNSAELSDAINSMYRWYKSSQICYTYLSDVPTNKDPSESNSAFRRSRWFTRGWTLQELIAPRNLVFYDQKWKPMGTRLEFAALVKDITAVPAHMLSADASKPWPNTAIRMSWAANRATSRAEDIAYCLLGIFDIQMPLLYGEGNAAFQRLQLELLKQSEDESLLAWGLDSSVQLIIKPPNWRGLVSVANNSRPSRGRGVLAHHPGAFRSWQGLEASEEDTSKWPPRSKMQATKSGLEITVPLIKLRGRCYAVLNCSRSAHLADLLLVPLFLQAGSGKSTITYSRGQNIICASWAVLDQAAMQTIILSTASDVAPGSEQVHGDFLPLHALQDDVLIVRLRDVVAETTMTVDHCIARDHGPALVPFFVSPDQSLDKRNVQWINDHDHIVRLKYGVTRVNRIASRFKVDGENGVGLFVLTTIETKQGDEHFTCVIGNNVRRQPPEELLDLGTSLSNSCSITIDGRVYSARVDSRLFLGFRVHTLDLSCATAQSVSSSSIMQSIRRISGKLGLQRT